MKRCHLGWISATLLLCSPLSGQQLRVLNRFQIKWNCHGPSWVIAASMYCVGGPAHELAKTDPAGVAIFDRLPRPSVGRASMLTAVAEDIHHNILAVDGIHIHQYSATAEYHQTITPGINLSLGIVPLDDGRIVVTGRRATTDPKKTSATVFIIGTGGTVEKEFSRPFFEQLTGSAFLAANSNSTLAFDRSKNLIYQLPELLYEIRVFDIQGASVRTIMPPEEFRFRTPPTRYGPNGAAGIEPTDALDSIVVLPNGGLAVSGVTLNSAQRSGANVSVDYSRFVDVYDSGGNFTGRLREAALQVGTAHFCGLDHANGKVYFCSPTTLVEAEIR